mmetsp:Transcript_53306/g.155302  ORF Transcript_53306/g.155302 Transcript_53306/m.155302 type:complete len:212 (-) Transcript_53306:474-1109(-)
MTPGMKPVHSSMPATSMHRIRVRKCPQSVTRLVFTVRTSVSTSISSCCFSLEPAAKADSSWVSSLKRPRSSARSFTRCSRTWWFLARSASASTHTSMRPCIYLCSSFNSMLFCFKSSSIRSFSVAHMTSIRSTRFTAAWTCSFRAKKSCLISCSSLTLICLSFSCAFRRSFWSCVRSRQSSSMTGTSSSRIFLSTLWMYSLSSWLCSSSAV